MTSSVVPKTYRYLSQRSGSSYRELFVSGTSVRAQSLVVLLPRTRKSALVILLVTVVILTVGCGPKKDATSSTQSAGPPPAESLPTWQPDGAMLAQLGPVTDIEHYQVRPPQGYSLKTSTYEPRSYRAFDWTGARRADKTVPWFSIHLETPTGASSKLTPGQILARSGELAMEYGQVNGLTFVRARSDSASDSARLAKQYQENGHSTPTKAKRHTLTYVAKDGSTLIRIIIGDSEPHHEQTLKLMEAAAHTFKRK